MPRPNVGVLIIVGILLLAGCRWYQENQAQKSDNRPPAVMCIVGTATDCGPGE